MLNMRSVLDVFNTPRRRWSRRHPSKRGLKSFSKLLRCSGSVPVPALFAFPFSYSLNKWFDQKRRTDTCSGTKKQVSWANGEPLNNEQVSLDLPISNHEHLALLLLLATWNLHLATDLFLFRPRTCNPAPLSHGVITPYKGPADTLSILILTDLPIRSGCAS